MRALLIADAIPVALRRSRPPPCPVDSLGSSVPHRTIGRDGGQRGCTHRGWPRRSDRPVPKRLTHHIGAEKEQERNPSGRMSHRNAPGRCEGTAALRDEQRNGHERISPQSVFEEPKHARPYGPDPTRTSGTQRKESVAVTPPERRRPRHVPIGAPIAGGPPRPVRKSDRQQRYPAARLEL